MEPAVLETPKHSPLSSHNTPRRLIRKPEVLRMVGVGNTTLYAMIGRGEFPAPVRLSARSVAWDSWAVERFIAERIAASQGTEAGK